MVTTLAGRAGLALLAGLLMLAAFPPYGLWWTAPMGLALLLLAVRGTTCRSAYVLAVVSGLSLFLPLLEWLRFLGVVPWLALSLLQAGLAALLGPVAVLVVRRGEGRWVTLAGLVGAVVVVEAVRARLPFGGLTWGRLAFGQSEGPLLPWAQLGGAPLVSATTAVVGIGLYLVVVGVLPGIDAAPPLPARRLRLTGAALALVPFLGAALPLSTEGRQLEVAAVQGNVPGQGLDAFAEDLVVLDNHVSQSERLADEVSAGTRSRPDLVIWPENAADQDPRSEPQTQQRLARAAARLQQPFLLGAVFREGDGLANGLLVWGRDGVQGPVYRKRHLVPFGEYLPLRSLIERLYPPAGRLLPRDFRPGQDVGLLTLNGVRLAVGTCFEVAFDDLPREAVRAGGELLVLPSNNASYGRSGQSAQQLAMARLRAVEHSRSTVVSTTSGISALVLPDGRVVARSGLFEPALVQARLPRRATLTFATRNGPAVEAGLAALVLLPLVGRRLSTRRNGTGYAARSEAAVPSPRSDAEPQG